MYLYLFLSVIICLLHIFLYKNNIIKIYVHNIFGWFGIQLFQTIYTMTSAIQSNKSVYCDLVLINRYSDHINIYLILHRFTETIMLCYVKPGFKLMYKVDGKILDLPYEEGTPFQIDRGELILYKRIIKRFGFINEEISRSKKWPIIL